MSEKKKTKKMKKVVKYNLEVFILFIAVVMIWWAIWGFLDLFLFPNNRILAYIAILFIGLLIIYLDEYDLEDFI